MFTTRLLKISLATITVGFSLGASACPPGGPGGFPSMVMPISPLFMPPPGALTLDDAQDQQLFVLMQSQAKARHEAMRGASKTLEALRALAHAQSFDATKVRALADEHGRQIAELSFIHAQGEAALRAVLTDEQRQRFDQLAPGGHDGRSCRRSAP